MFELLLAGVAGLAALHLGAAHGLERWLVPLLAFGPFVVLGVVVYVVRRRDLAEDQTLRDHADTAGHADPADAAVPD